jgi:hypothetical protein
MPVKSTTQENKEHFLQFNHKISTSVATQGLLHASDSFFLADNIVIYFKVFVLLSTAQKNYWVGRFVISGKLGAKVLT